jgi:hypothetical protein
LERRAARRAKAHTAAVAATLAIATGGEGHIDTRHKAIVVMAACGRSNMFLVVLMNIPWFARNRTRLWFVSSDKNVDSLERVF